MKTAIDIKRVKLYLWIGLAYLLVWLLRDLITEPNTFFPERFINNIWRTVYIVVVNYIFFEYTVPYVLLKRKYVIYNILLGILALWVHLMLWSYGLYAWRLLGIQVHVYTALTTFTSLDHALETQMAYSAGSVFFFGIIRHIYDYIQLKQAAKQLRIEKQEAELNYLKSQTNPHFLFNTLNNIYSLARDKSDLAPEAIMRLSKILRYMLYEASGEYISIEQELTIINDYISLEKLRYDESLRVNFNHNIEDMKQSIPPLLLMPLVENAFKHGVAETRSNPFVEIHLSVNNRQLVFVITNSAEMMTEDVKENIGLSNLRRQLELLYQEFELTTKHESNGFKATLKVNLASHV